MSASGCARVSDTALAVTESWPSAQNCHLRAGEMGLGGRVSSAPGELLGSGVLSKLV